jgi:hypothetical protein
MWCGAVAQGSVKAAQCRQGDDVEEGAKAAAGIGYRAARPLEGVRGSCRSRSLPVMQSR